MAHDVTPLRHAGYAVDGPGMFGYRIVAPDGATWAGSEAEVVAAGLTHMGLTTGHDGDLLTATVAVRGDDGALVARRFAGTARMVKVDDWGNAERVRAVREPGGTYRWDASNPPLHSGIGYYHRWFGLTGRWADEVAEQRASGQGDPMAPVYRTRRSRSTGLVTHTRCGQPIGTVTRTAAGRDWRAVTIDGGETWVRATMGGGQEMLIRHHLPECPHSGGCRMR